MNNIDLVKHCKMALQQKWGYVWGTFGQQLTNTLFNQKLKQYPDGVGKYKAFIQQNWVGRRTADCIGLIKSYVWWNKGSIKYNASQDTNADGMYRIAKEKGPISTLPEIPGICLWKKGHIGVYIGGGQVIESRGTTSGVIQSPLQGSGSAGWTHWLKCPYITYVDSNTKPQEKSEKVRISINGKILSVNGQNKDGTTFVRVNGLDVPLRKTLETLGFTVTWDNNKEMVVAK